MNPKAQQVHAANRERMLREREAMRSRFVTATDIKRNIGIPNSRFSRGVAEEDKRELRMRNCLRCGDSFKSEGAHHRMCCDCARLPEGFGL